MYIRNSSPNGSWMKGWFPPQKPFKPLNNENLSLMISILNAYTGRQLTYKWDAIAAIASALMAVGGGTPNHLWGLPLRRSQLSEIDDSWGLVAGLALSWYHTVRYRYQTVFSPHWLP
jgi:hypothetical protein